MHGVRRDTHAEQAMDSSLPPRLNWNALAPGSVPTAVAQLEDGGLAASADTAVVCASQISRNYHLVPPPELEAPIE